MAYTVTPAHCTYTTTGITYTDGIVLTTTNSYNEWQISLENSDDERWLFVWEGQGSQSNTCTIDLLINEIPSTVVNVNIIVKGVDGDGYDTYTIPITICSPSYPVFVCSPLSPTITADTEFVLDVNSNISGSTTWTIAEKDGYDKYGYIESTIYQDTTNASFELGFENINQIPVGGVYYYNLQIGQKINSEDYIYRDYTVTLRNNAEQIGTITISQKSHTIDYNGGTYIVGIVTENMSSISADSNEQWVDVDSADLQMVRLHVDVNTYEAQRTATITVSGYSTSNTKVSNTFYITQYGAPVPPPTGETGTITLEYTQKRFNYNAVTGSCNVTKTNIPSLTLSNSVDWIELNRTTMVNDGAIIFTLTENTGSERTGYIGVYGNDTNGNFIDKTITIIQNEKTIVNGYLTITSPTSMTFGLGGGKGKISYTPTNIKNVIATTEDNWIVINSYNNYTTNFTVNQNIQGNRSGLITIEATDNNDLTHTYYVDITQTTINSNPIWKDTFFSITNIGELDYYVMLDNNIIYNGKLVRFPDSNKIELKINDIVRDYLDNGLPNGFENGSYPINEYSKEFTIITNNQTHPYIFYNSYAYENLPYNGCISVPIKNIIDKRQFFISSFYFDNTSNTNVRIQGIDNNGNITNIFNEEINAQKQHVYIWDDLHGYKQINSNGKLYDVVETCANYCLYYCNAFGGWDSLLVEGNVLRTDTITSYQYTKSFNNNTIEFENKKYLNVINPTFKCYTNYFTDDEQSKLWHLFESTLVYLHDLNSGEILPVNIKNNKVDYTTFSNNGKKKFYNIIELEVAQERIRK